MLFVWIFAVGLFLGVLVYLWNSYKLIQDRRKFLDDFEKGHKKCITWQSSTKAWWMAAGAVVVLVAGLWMLFQDLIQPALPFALVLMGLALLLLCVAVKTWFDTLMLFYSQGFIWEEMIFPYRSITIDGNTVISEVPIPLTSRASAKVREEYDLWKEKKGRYAG